MDHETAFLLGTLFGRLTNPIGLIVVIFMAIKMEDWAVWLVAPVLSFAAVETVNSVLIAGYAVKGLPTGVVAAVIQTAIFVPLFNRWRKRGEYHKEPGITPGAP